MNQMTNRTMRKIRRLTAICAALAVLAAALGAWAAVVTVKYNKLSAASQTGVLNAVAAVADPTAAAAEFDGGVVTVAEASAEYQTIASYYQLIGMNEADYADSAKQEVLDGLVETKILELKAKEAGVYELTDAEEAEIEENIRSEYEANVEYYMAFRYDENKTEDEIRQETIDYLDQNGYAYEALLQDAQQQAWREKLFDAVTRDLDVSDDQLREFYDSQLASDEEKYSADFAAYEADTQGGRTPVWNPGGVRRIQYIEIPFDDAQTQEYAAIQDALAFGDSDQMTALDALYSALQPQAQAVLDRLNAGERFESLMAEIGGSGEAGICVSDLSTLCGDEFRDAAMALSSIGDVSGLVKTDTGYRILRYAADVPAGAASFDSVKDTLRETYAVELKTSAYNAQVGEWIQEANVKYYPERF